MTKREKELYEIAETEFPGVALYWLPGNWLISVIEAMK